MSAATETRQVEHVVMFMRCFATAVLEGKKRRTIRPRRLRAIRAGDVLDLRAWNGRPYGRGVKQIRLSRVTCTRVLGVRISEAGIELRDERTHEYKALTREQADQFALLDGFRGVSPLGSMLTFFMAQHGLPFCGELIEW